MQGEGPALHHCPATGMAEGLGGPAARPSRRLPRAQTEHNDGLEANGAASPESGALGGVVRGGAQVANRAAAAKIRAATTVGGKAGGKVVGKAGGSVGGWWRTGGRAPAGRVSKIADLADNTACAVEEVVQANIEAGGVRKAGVQETLARAAPSLLRSVAQGTVLFLTYETLQASAR